jgi:NADP-dependent 3-hydroxy acid dehydrogenase YdfG
MSTLSGKVAVITGASSGIGEATAIVLASRGARVVAAARRGDRLEALAERIAGLGAHALPVRCDVAKRADVNELMNRAVHAFGRIDILINNAAIMANAPIVNCRMDDWDDMIDINLKGLLYGIGHVLPIMLKQKTGHIINISSVAGRKLFPGAAVYCGTKHAVHAISEGLRGELAEFAAENGNNIRVTVIAPGVVATELVDSIRDDAAREASRNYYGSFSGPLTSEDVAQSILYALEAPPHVNVNEILVRPTAQVR